MLPGSPMKSAVWRAGLIAAAYVILAVLWHITANRLDLTDTARGIGKGTWLGAAGVLFVLASVRLTSKARRGVLKGALQSGLAIALAAFVLALIEAWRTDWGEACNQCGDAWQWPLVWPATAGALAFIAALAIGRAATGVSVCVGMSNNRIQLTALRAAADTAR